MGASPSRGAICELDASTEIVRSLWEAGEKRGGYIRLETRARAFLRSMGRLAPECEEATFEEDLPRRVKSP